VTPPGKGFSNLSHLAWYWGTSIESSETCVSSYPASSWEQVDEVIKNVNRKL